MTISKQCIKDISTAVSTAVIEALEQRGLVGKAQDKPTPPGKSAYQKTEQLLYNYVGFKRIVQERRLEIEELRMYGVPQSVGSGQERVQSSRNVQGIVLPEESVENAVQRVEASVQSTIRVINLIDRCMQTLRNEPYYETLEMFYFEGRTLEDIGVYYGCDHTTISRNKSKLVKQLAMRIFPDDVINEYMK